MSVRNPALRTPSDSNHSAGVDCSLMLRWWGVVHAGEARASPVAKWRWGASQTLHGSNAHSNGRLSSEQLADHCRPHPSATRTESLNSPCAKTFAALGLLCDLVEQPGRPGRGRFGDGARAIGLCSGITKAYTTRAAPARFDQSSTMRPSRRSAMRGREFGTRHRKAPALPAVSTRRRLRQPFLSAASTASR